jgi:hypothetical protein
MVLIKLSRYFFALQLVHEVYSITGPTCSNWMSCNYATCANMADYYGCNCYDKWQYGSPSPAYSSQYAGPCGTCYRVYMGMPDGCPANGVSSCPAGQWLNNGACSTCPAGGYCTGGTAGPQQCAAGTYSAAGATSCTTCAAGTYSAAQASSCTACTACSAGQYESTACSSTTNRVCTTCATCSAGNYMTTACSATANTVCSPCTTCSAGNYMTTACSATANTVCSPCTTCSAGNYTTTACSATANTVCSPCTSCPANNYASTKCSATSDNVCASCPVNAVLCNGTDYVTEYCSVYNQVYNSSLQCVDCPISFYCPGNNLQTACGTGTTSTPGSSLANECESLCASGTYKTWGTTSTTALADTNTQPFCGDFQCNVNENNFDWCGESGCRFNPTGDFIKKWAFTGVSTPGLWYHVTGCCWGGMNGGNIQGLVWGTRLWSGYHTLSTNLENLVLGKYYAIRFWATARYNNGFRTELYVESGRSRRRIFLNEDGILVAPWKQYFSNGFKADNSTTRFELRITKHKACASNPCTGSDEIHGWFDRFEVTEIETSCPQCPVQNYCNNNQQYLCPSNSLSVAGSGAVTDCSGCLVGYEKTGPASCQICPTGYFCNGTSGVKYSCTVCSYGMYPAIPCTTSSDTVCKCASGFANATDSLLILKHSFENPAPYTSDATSFGKPNISFVGKYWSVGTTWKKFGSQSIFTDTESRIGGHIYEDKTIINGQPAYKEAYVKFSTNKAINFAKGNYSFSFFYRFRSSRAVIASVLRIGPLYFGQMGHPGTWMFLSAVNKMQCLVHEGWKWTTKCDKHSGTTWRPDVNCHHVEGTGCLGDVVYHSDGSSSDPSGWTDTFNPYKRTYKEHHVVITSEAKTNSIQMRLFINGNEALNAQTVDVVHNNDAFLNTDFYEGYFGLPGDGSGVWGENDFIKLPFYSLTQPIEMDEFQIYNRLLNQTEMTLLRKQEKISSECKICDASMFCPKDSDSFTCPASFVSPTGSSSVDNCTVCPNNSTNLQTAGVCSDCKAGYIYLGEASCSECRSGYQCPNKSTELICSTGFFSKAASTTCTACTANTYSNTAGSESCTACPANSNAAVGSTSILSCNCNNGFYKDSNLACVACSAGSTCTFNTMSVCAAGSFSIAGASVCSLCATGTYSGSAGSSACTQCPALMTTPGTGRTDLDNCTCATSGWFRNSSTTCRACTPGYMCPTYNQESICQKGFFSLSGASLCTACPTGTYSSNVGSSACTQCPALMTTFATGQIDLNNCTCATSGWFKNSSTTCRPCRAGYACPNVLQENNCPLNTYSLSGYTSCVNCLSNSVSLLPNTSTGCVCNAGYLGRGIDSNSFLATGEQDLARSCTSGGCTIKLYSDTPGNTSIWTGYQAGSLSMPTNGNYYFEGDHNWAGVGTYQIDLQKVQKLGNIYFWDNGGGGGRNIPTHFYAGHPTPKLITSIWSWWCCGFNKIDALYGIETQFIWWYHPNNDWHHLWKFAIGTYQPSQRQCALCAVGSYCPTEASTVICPVNHTSLAGSTNVSHCYCSAGYINLGYLSCRICTAGYSCPTVTPGSVSAQSVSSLIFTETICPTGSFSAAGATACTTCAANSYSEFAGSTTCINCPANSAGSAGSTSKSGCNCVNGYYRDVNLNCIICPSGYRCTGNTMTACGIGTSSAIGASACSACEQGTYSDRVGLPGCISCPNGKIVTQESNVELFNEAKARANAPVGSNELYIQRMQLPTSAARFNITKFTFYATQACTITPVIFQSMAAVGLGGYQNVNMQPMTVGTTRSVPGPGKYSYDFITGQKFLSKQYTLQSGSNYNNLEYLGWYFTGPACIPFDVGAPNANTVLDYVVSTHSYNASQSILSQNFPNNVDLGAAKKSTFYSITMNYSITTSVFATTATGSTSIFNCSCGAGLRTLSDGNCQGLCVDGKYMAREEDEFCTVCPQGSYCTKSLKYPCATQTSAPPQSGQCFACVGPDTHSDVSLVMCGLKTCAAANLVSIGATGWQGLGQVLLAQGGNGVIPTTHWFSGDRCLGLVLNATGDRPVSLVQQTLSVTAGKTYAIRFKYVCTGSQCGANFKVSLLETSTVFLDLTFVKRSWVEEASAYFTPTTSSVTIQFRAQMVTSSCTIWLARVQLVDLGRWSYSSIGHLQLKTGVDLPNRYSANYVSTESFVLMQIATGGYVEQTAGTIVGVTYELKYWYSGTVVPTYYNGSAYVSMVQGPAYDTAVGYTQAVLYVVPTFTPILVRFTGPGSMTKPVLQVYTPLADSPCRNCLNNYWCAGSTLNRCPLNTISSNGSRLQTDCYCKPGYYGIVGANVSEGYSPCALCLMNRYCNGGNHMAVCPPGTKSMPGSDLSGCTPCAEGEYCQNGLVGICPMNSWSPSGSDEVEDCACQPGYYGTRGNCTLCEVGFYCPGNPTRYACTANAVSPIGSVTAEQCFCDRGYYGVNNTPCTACQEGYWCWTGIRNLCPPNMWSPLKSSYQSECICQYGYTGPNGGPCTSCSTGQYKNTRGTANCDLCAAGTSSGAIAATSVATCSSCGYGQYNMYSGQSTCTLCDAGTATNQFGSTICGVCAAGKWSPQGAATCSNCLAGTYSTTVGASSISLCLTCQPGSYSSAGSTVCLLCGACSYWNWPMKITFGFTLGAATTFAGVGANAGSMMTLQSSSIAIVNDVSELYRLNILTGTVTSFTYDKKDTTAITHLEASMDRTSLYMVQNGYAYRFTLPAVQSLNAYGDEGIGALGITENAWGNAVWITCSGNMKSYNKDTEVLITTVSYPTPFTLATTSPCVHTSYPNEIFVAGKSGQGGFGFRKYNFLTNTWTTVTVEVTSLNKCEFTPDGLFVFLTSSSNTWVWNMIDSTMTRFYVGQVNGMIVDPDQNFVLLARQLNSVQKQTILIQDPRNCPTAKYNLLGGLQSASECITCPAGSLCPGGAVITQCSAGTYSQTTALREQGQCSLCPSGFFCTGGTGYQICPLGSYSLATGVTKVADCNKCPAGFYCTNVTTIQQCPSNTNSPQGSSDLAQCVCDPGYKCEVTKVVHAEVTLPISIVDFEALRQQYILAVAAAAGVDPSQVVIVSVTSSTPTSGRRLLSEYCEIHTSIYNSRHHDKPHLAFKDLGKHLVARGLPHHHKDIKVTLHHEITHSRRR